jgi:hypothetical protein
MRKLLLGAALVALLAAGAARAEEPGQPRLDRYGDPLPAGAAMRLAGIRLRPERPSVAAAFALDGKTLYTIGQEPVLHARDPATGQLLRRLRLPGTGGRCLLVTPGGEAGGQAGHGAVAGLPSRQPAAGFRQRQRHDLAGRR